MTIGIPIAMLTDPSANTQSCSPSQASAGRCTWTANCSTKTSRLAIPSGGRKKPGSSIRDVKAATLCFPASKPEARPAQTPAALTDIQYWTPPGHNTWVGDVVTLFHKGRYHVFYLYDRRHHQSKFGCGAHLSEHISTEDFKTWKVHEAATPLEEQWECIGTGTPFVFQDQLCISYGLHTTHVYPQEQTTLPAKWEYLKEHGHTGELGARQRQASPQVPAMP